MLKPLSRFWHEGRVLEDPPIARTLFSDARFAWFWLLVRVYIGYEWLMAGIEKYENPAWVVTGEGLKNYWVNAVKLPATGKPPITYDWYREFLNYLLVNNAHAWFAKLVVYGEILVGIGLIVGALVGVAAFFGALMNLNFMLAGSASTNPVLFLLAALLMMAWKTAGYYGVDQVLLPAIGTPWQPGLVFHRRQR